MKELIYLMNLTQKKDNLAIKNYLTNLPSSLKGKVFELYLQELYKGNGFLAVRKGGRNDGSADVLLYDPRNPHDVFSIIQAKNHNIPLTVDGTATELRKFDTIASKKYKCRHYKLISINGFVSEAEDVEKFNTMQKNLNISLHDWFYVEDLIRTYDPTNNQSPHIDLRSHNKITYENILSQWKESNRVAAVQATGTGKSFLIAKCLSDLADKKKMVLAPSHFILNQLKDNFPWLEMNTIFMTYQKAALLSEDEIHELNVSLIVLDEFHRIGAEQWGEGVDKLVDIYPNAKILGTSATPIRYLDGNRDISDEFFEKNLANNLSLADAIAQVIIPTPKYISALYTLEQEIDRMKHKIEFSENAQEEKKRFLNLLNEITINWKKSNGIEDILKKHISNENKFIVFCKDKKHLEDMEVVVWEWFKDANFGKRIRTKRVMSDDRHSKKEMKEFINGKDKDTIYLLFCIDMLNEGLHIKDVDGVILLRPTVSPIIFYQQMGRTIDAGKANTPLIFDFVNNFSTIKSNDFLNDLRNSEMKLNCIRSEFGLSNINSHFEFFVSDEIHDVQNLFAQLESKLLNSWDAKYQELMEYKNINDDCLVSTYDESNKELGSWVKARRAFYKKGKLSQDKIDKLNEIGFVWDTLEAKWEETFLLLCEYKNVHGDCLVSKSEALNKELGIWVSNQRKNFKNGKLSQDKFDKLNEIGFVWYPFDVKWEEMFTLLLEYKSLHYNCLVPHNYELNKELARWVSKQRANYKKDILSQDKIDKLNEIGFVWDTLEAKWEEIFSLLLEYRFSYGNCLVSAEVNKELGNWVRTQRKAFNKGSLSQDKINKLNEIGFDWDPHEAKWEEMFSLLLEYKSLHDNCLVSICDELNKKLGGWVGTQRGAFKKGALSEDKINKLNEIGFDWDPHEAKWEEMFSLLLEYKSLHYNCLVPHNYELNEEFGHWVAAQRRSFKKCTLLQDKIDKLNDIGFIWDVDDFKWEKMFSRLEKYKSLHGDCLVSASDELNKELARWVSKQRANYKKGTLSQDKIDKLNEIGFVWDAKK